MAAVTPNTGSVIVSGTFGDASVLRATFPATVNDGDTWSSGLGTRVIDYWTQDIDNPSTQGACGVAISNSTGTFTFYPAEEGKSFYLFARISGC